MTVLTSVLMGKDHILGGSGSKREVIQVLGIQEEQSPRCTDDPRSPRPPADRLPRGSAGATGLTAAEGAVSKQRRSTPVWAPPSYLRFGLVGLWGGCQEGPVVPSEEVRLEP